MINDMKKVELLAPAGNLEKLKMAIMYGADAVYLGGEAFGLRASSDNFSLSDMELGVQFAHQKGKKVFLTMNIIPHNSDLDTMSEYTKQASQTGIDAIIVSDPGVFSIVREVVPNMEIHISTQANNTNWRSSTFWYEHGAKRVVLARELSLGEITEIRTKIPKELELEIFVHGAMCISYSGRCLLSSYMANRDSNRGLCAHPCRWKYYLMEEKRPGEYMPVFEDDKGTYILNSKDLCMIEHIPELVASGVSSLKIEGRMKSSYYVATVVSAYRKALDSYYKDPERYEFNPIWLDEVSKASHREFTTGFFFGKANENTQNYNTSSYVRDYEFMGLVTAYDCKTGIATIEQRNKMQIGDEIEILNPDGSFFTQTIENMKSQVGEDISEAPHPQMMVFMKVDSEVTPCSILRKPKTT